MILVNDNVQKECISNNIESLLEENVVINHVCLRWDSFYLSSSEHLRKLQREAPLAVFLLSPLTCWYLSISES